MCIIYIMLNYNEIKPGKVLNLDGEPLEVVWTSGIVKKQRQKPHLGAKLKNLISGATVERTFTQSDKTEEAELETREIKYLYTNRGESWFCDVDNPSNRFTLPESQIESKLPYMKENDMVEAQIFDEEVIGVKLPIKIVLKVAEAPPNIKGNTASGGNKVVVLETGLKVTTPLFIETGDTIRVNTETGEYAERVQ